MRRSDWLRSSPWKPRPPPTSGRSGSHWPAGVTEAEIVAVVLSVAPVVGAARVHSAAAALVWGTRSPSRAPRCRESPARGPDFTRPDRPPPGAEAVAFSLSDTGDEGGGGPACRVVDEEAFARQDPRRRLFESKLVPSPITRPETVRRTRVLESGPIPDRDRPIVSVVAPPGYGKTTSLAEWAERSATRCAVALRGRGRQRPGEPARVHRGRARHPRRVDRSRGWFRRPAPCGLSVASTVVPQLAGAMYSMSAPVSLFSRRRRPAAQSRKCLDAIAELAAPPSGRIPARDGDAGATRRSRWRGRAPVAASSRSVSPSSRWMRTKAWALARGRGTRRCPAGETAALLERTEGWPVGL